MNFSTRHIGPSDNDIKKMLSFLGFNSLNELIDATIPKGIKYNESLNIGESISEYDFLKTIKKIGKKNKVAKSYIGTGYYGTITPPVILRNILENPGWYTAYTPYQAEISQGRLEALLNFQTMVTDLTGLEISNASLLDEATAAAEAMVLMYRSCQNRNSFLVSDQCHPQTISVLKTRSKPIGINLKVIKTEEFDFSEDTFGCLIQCPTTDGKVFNYKNLSQDAHDSGAFIAVATDLLSLALIAEPGSFDVDIAIGSSQRFGVPLGFGGPHAAFLAAKENFKRKMPGRIIGLSKDSDDNLAFRMALQTREQHIRRDKATSNICTAQVLLSVIAGMYAVYHGPKGIHQIAKTIHENTKRLASSLKKNGYEIRHDQFFDTIRFGVNGKNINTENLNINFRYFKDGDIGISIDETISESDIYDLLNIFKCKEQSSEYFTLREIRKSEYLTHEVFNSYHSETEMMRYLKRLETKDLSLNTSMISLGSCTMKLNAAAEMIPISWPEFSEIHPFAPETQTLGYQELFKSLEDWLVNITGLHSCSLQPNSGAQGEYAGLMVVRAYHQNNGNPHRNICLIPESAHGTNPASAVMAGMKVVVIKCDQSGNIDVNDLKQKAEEHKETLSALMITYPSTHGVFEESISDICNIIHHFGGQVYLDGANLNAMVGLSRLGDFGADVCHINLHKTFAIPHGGGGPGMGPICVAEHLSPFLPGHPYLDNNDTAISAISAAPFGSASILPISWGYIVMLGNDGLKKASEVAILNANYMAKRLENDYKVLYQGFNKTSAHEFIIDLRDLKAETGISDEDVAKRLIDYGFHAPTMSWPVPGTLMIEPTESEALVELDRFCDAMISIKREIDDVVSGKLKADDNPLINAPHTAIAVMSDNWLHQYSRETAAYPASWLKEHKYWPSVGRVDNAFGDRNLVCTCPPIDAYSK
jgi:glycine dehydrogenase